MIFGLHEGEDQEDEGGSRSKNMDHDAASDESTREYYYEDDNHYGWYAAADDDDDGGEDLDDFDDYHVSG